MDYGSTRDFRCLLKKKGGCDFTFTGSVWCLLSVFCCEITWRGLDFTVEATSVWGTVGLI
ncbi:hypothetical protein EVA_17111 [gut metagenome]|uniref:Uncharacterized protein n=1 Tax=gut metagenome TaxID=749906 RepID=J9FIP2_9ZZZZ